MDQTNSSIPAQRQQIIMEYLMEKSSISIREAADLCHVSDATARRDLDDMAVQGLIERTHGGAVVERGTGLEKNHAEKMKIMIPEKTRIAMEAAKMICDGNSIFLDSGTTTFLLAKQLQGFKNLTVVTHNLDVAYRIKLDQTSTLILTGGIRRDGYNVLIGEIAEDLVNQLSVDIVFMGADAINAKYGVFNSSFLELGIKRSCLSSGKQKVLISDHTKFNRKALTKVCNIEEFDTVITDEGIDDESRQILETKIKKLIIVKNEAEGRKE
ncbi:MAG: DeoR/GlpR family DNA-binding transcription regulator [Lachnospiraceae bacterium]|nr:DeoR/GlpR family DNA-binding transcription regulator [Lachnospiraceae bacterium]